MFAFAAALDSAWVGFQYMSIFQRNFYTLAQVWSCDRWRPSQNYHLQDRKDRNESGPLCGERGLKWVGGVVQEGGEGFEGRL